MSTGIPSDDVINAIVRIRMHRQEMQKETGPSAASNEALRKLHELLERERHALQVHVPAAGHTANIEAVTAEIEAVRKLTNAGTKPAGRVPAQGQPKKRMATPSAPHNRPRNKGRRTMGRRGDR